MFGLSLTEEELPKVVSREDAGHVLYVMTGDGIAPGSFTATLIEAIARADAHNLCKLGREFPGLAAAVDAYKNADYGLSALQKILRG